MKEMKHIQGIRPLLITLFLLAIPIAGIAQTAVEKSTQGSAASKTAPNQLGQTRSDLIAATASYKASAAEVLRFQEAELATATKKLDELRVLVTDGLIARNELTKAEEELTAAKAKLESTKQQIAESDSLVAQVKKAEEAEKAFVKNQASQAALGRRLVTPTSVRYNGMAGWALTNINLVQSFFTSTFGRPLPISTLGQSATHNAMRWDHRNSVDVGIHPDSAEGRALLAYLQSRGIPFLAFRGAIAGVSTGPHIHIGYPSQRMG